MTEDSTPPEPMPPPEPVMPEKPKKPPSKKQGLDDIDADPAAGGIKKQADLSGVKQADLAGLVDKGQFQGLQDALKRQSELRSILGDASSLKFMQDMVNPAGLKLIGDLSPSLKLLGDSLERLGKLPQPILPIQPSRPYTIPMPPPPDARTVSVLTEVHAELEGMASVLTEGARQTQVMVEVTTASLTALQAVIDELKISRKASDASNRVLFGLTVALLVAAAVAAVAVIPEFVREVGSFSNWVQSLR